MRVLGLFAGSSWDTCLRNRPREPHINGTGTSGPHARIKGSGAERGWGHPVGPHDGWEQAKSGPKHRPGHPPRLHPAPQLTNTKRALTVLPQTCRFLRTGTEVLGASATSASGRPRAGGSGHGSAPSPEDAVPGPRQEGPQAAWDQFGLQDRTQAGRHLSHRHARPCPCRQRKTNRGEH